jgi:hypothetical protein
MSPCISEGELTHRQAVCALMARRRRAACATVHHNSHIHRQSSRHDSRRLFQKIQGMVLPLCLLHTVVMYAVTALICDSVIH